MDRATALRIFGNLELARYESTSTDGETTEHPHLNVRLDAMTDRDDEREFRLFVRIDPSSPEKQSESNLRFICEEAKAAGLNVSIENGGVEITS